MTSRLLGTCVLAAGLAVLVAGRVPSGQPAFEVAAVVLAVLALVCALGASRTNRAAAFGAGVFVLTASLTLVPSSPEAILGRASPALGALAAGVALHVFFTQALTNAPLVHPAHAHVSRRLALQMLPAGLTIAALLAAPFAYPLVVPERIRSAYELHTALAPAMPLLFLATFLLAVSSARNVWLHARDSASETPEPPARALAEEGPT